jgi:predicted nucleotidyltransferase
MSKTIKYGLNGALIVGTGNAILNAINQMNRQDESITFNWKELFQAFCKGAFVGGASGLALGAIRDNDMNKILIATGGTASFIKEALNSYTNDDITLPKKAAGIQKQLYNEFREYLSEYPSINGSIIKGTSILNSDIDIQIKFNKDAGTIEDVRNIVEGFLRDSFFDNKLQNIRSQNHSIGLVFNINGEEKRIDIVPLREIENGKGDTYLYSTKNSSIKKTNAKIQISKLRFTEKQKQIIKLLKGWKIDNGLQLPSILIEYIVKRAFAEFTMPKRIDKALLFVIEYIANNITYIRVIDPSNTNNIISDSLSCNEKVELQDFCFKMLDEIKKDERNIIDYFEC